MKSDLHKLSPKELGLLFPIVITPYNHRWPDLYRKEEKRILKVLSEKNVVKIDHIGSTAVPNLMAKPVIDILLQVVQKDGIKEIVISGLENLKYEYIPKPENPAPHIMMVKGYTNDGFKGQMYHVHVRFSGDWNEIHFRDFLRKNPEKVRQYEVLKLKLSVEFKNDRDGYTEAKTDFIRNICKLTRK